MKIRAHSVPALPSGLSPMQERLLRSDKFVRLVSAPTGSGKSYAFMRAVLDDGARVLFIVPTKRLLQNLIDDAREQARQMLRQRKLSDAQADAWIDERIIEWSGNQAADGGESLTTKRVRQLLAGGPTGGRVIFAIPEVVVGLISGIRIAGAAAVNPFLYVRSFDHIVFDEFHTIDDRSFGLACLFSLLAVTERRGKVSLLSATPIDVISILTRGGVESNDIQTIAEEIVDGHPPGHRPIHGDVEISVRAGSIPESIAQKIEAVRRSVDGGHTVIVIYDSLQQLIQEAPESRRSLSGIGIDDKDILEIHSIADSERRPGAPRRGHRYPDPRAYKVLLCTSSVEIGVTFKSTLMFMEPGHGLAGFVQRVGRVARGYHEGQVIVSLSEQRRSRDAWTRRVTGVVEQHAETSIQTFTNEILRDVRQRLEPARAETDIDPAESHGTVPYYRRASWRGAFWAALFIVAIRRTRMKTQHEARERLQRIAPNVVRLVEAKIGEILSVDAVDPNQRRQRQPHRRWVTALLASALTYRNIGATIVAIDPNGTRHAVTESFLRRATTILERHVVSDEGDERVVELLSKTLQQEIQEPSDRSKLLRLRLYVPSPVGSEDFSLAIPECERDSEQTFRRLVEEWRQHFAALIPKRGDSPTDPRRKVIGAATDLVELLGRPPLDEDFEDAAESALFA